MQLDRENWYEVTESWRKNGQNFGEIVGPYFPGTLAHDQPQDTMTDHTDSTLSYAKYLYTK